MRRDVHLVKDILRHVALLDFNVETDDKKIHQEISSRGVSAPDLPGLIKEHMYTLWKGGFIEGRAETDGYQIRAVTAWRLTWEGHELLQPFNA